MNILNAELSGVYGADVLKELSDIINLYGIYENGEKWDNYDVDYKPTVKKVNHVKKLIKEESRFMFSKTPIFNAVSENEDAAEIVEDYINKVLDNNLFSNKLVNAGKDAFIGKRVAIKLHADTVNKDIRIMFVPSMEFIFEPFENKIDELKKIVFFHTVEDSSDRKEQVIWKQKYEMIDGKCILNEGFYDGTGKVLDIISDNVDLKLSGIPCYVIINDGLSGDLKGESDVEEIRDNALEYNKLSSADIDTLRKGMDQIIYGTDVDQDSSDNFKRKPGAYWDVQTDITKDNKQAVIGTIEANFGYNERIENTLKNLKYDMHDVLNIPLINLADMQGAITSGKGMKALYWKLITRCEEKWATWKPALRWMCFAIIEMSKIYNIETLPDIEDLKIVIENRYPLQEDEDLQKELDMKAVLNQCMSRKSYMRKWGLTDELALEEIKQIALERQQLESDMTIDYE